MSDLFDRPIPAPDRTFAYGPDAAHVADLWIREEMAPVQWIFALHGGWWRAEHDRAHLGHLCRALRDNGFAVLNVEYRRLGMPGVGAQAMLADVSAAVARASELVRCSPVRSVPPVLLGHSAGGHLALMLSKQARVSGVVALAPITDLRLAASLRLGDGIVDELLASDGAPREEAIARGSPAECLPMGARQIVLHGTEDVGVPLAMSEAYVAKAHAFGDRAELRRLAGVDHLGLIDPEASAFALVRAALRDLADSA